MTISDERLAELIEQSVYGRFTDSNFEDDSSAALRELQACRALLSTHYDACHGAGCSACIGYADLYPERPVG